MDYKQTDFTKFGADCFPGLLGIEVLNVSTNSAAAQMEIRKSFCTKVGGKMNGKPKPGGTMNSTWIIKSSNQLAYWHIGIFAH